MASSSQSPERFPDWSQEAFAMAAQAKVLSGKKLEQQVVRLQRHSGRSKDACWRFIIQHGIKETVDHTRWTEPEFETLREELVKHSVEVAAKKLHRTAAAVRSILKRNHLNLRDIRCDLFSVESLACALRVQRAEVLFWIDQSWLQASIETRGQKRFYTITPEAFALLYKHHLPDILTRGTPNQSLFEAYLQYCYSPKHTVGRQLLDVRRDKKERAAYAALQDDDAPGEGDEEDEGEERYHLDVQTDSGFDDDADHFSE